MVVMGGSAARDPAWVVTSTGAAGFCGAGAVTRVFPWAATDLPEEAATGGAGGGATLAASVNPAVGRVAAGAAGVAALAVMGGSAARDPAWVVTSTGAAGFCGAGAVADSANPAAGVALALVCPSATNKDPSWEAIMAGAADFGCREAAGCCGRASPGSVALAATFTSALGAAAKGRAAGAAFTVGGTAAAGDLAEESASGAPGPGSASLA